MLILSAAVSSIQEWSQNVKESAGVEKEGYPSSLPAVIPPLPVLLHHRVYSSWSTKGIMMLIPVCTKSTNLVTPSNGDKTVHASWIRSHWQGETDSSSSKTVLVLYLYNMFCIYILCQQQITYNGFPFARQLVLLFHFTQVNTHKVFTYSFDLPQVTLEPRLSIKEQKYH